MSGDQQYPFKGVWIPVEIWLSKDLTWMEKCLLADINALDGPHGCTASNKYFADKFKSSEASIANQICKLRSLGWVETANFNGRSRTLHVNADLTQRLSQPKPSGESCDNPAVKSLYRHKKEENKPSERGFKFADWFKTLIPETLKLSVNWREQWAKCFDDMIRLDSRTAESITKVCKWARPHEFWKKNFLSPCKLRERNQSGIMYFDVFAEDMNNPKTPNGQAKPHGRPDLDYYDPANTKFKTS